MTDTTEQKALALLREVEDERGTTSSPGINRVSNNHEALCRAIEQHEAFRQEVSDAVERAVDDCGHDGLRKAYVHSRFFHFIIAKPDPLVEALDEALWEVCNVKLTDRELRDVSLRLNAKRGGKIKGEKQ